MKKIIVLTALAALSLSTIGCGEKPSTTPSPPATPANDSKAMPQSADAPPPAPAKDAAKEGETK